MPEPTIKELMECVESVSDLAHPDDRECWQAIRAILVERRDLLEPVAVLRQLQLEAIRAFIERVEKRLPDYNTGKGADSWLKAYRLAVMDELAVMEKGDDA